MPTAIPKFYTADALAAPRMTDEEIARHLANLKSHRLGGAANDALVSELKRLEAAYDMARRTGADTAGPAAELKSYVIAVGNERWIRQVERRERRGQ